MQRNSRPLSWRPKGVSDTLDGSTAFSGAMASLQNLIPDPTTAHLWQCRPASLQLISFGSGAGFISCFKIIGNMLYGMRASGSVAGHDEPFAYNLATNLQVTVTGTQNSTTLPSSPPSTGAWTPPQMDVISTKLFVAHSGFSGAGGNFIGWFDVSTPTSPVWNAGNLTGAVSFTVAPTAVAQFNGRAYYIHNSSTPAVIFSDSLNPTVVTNANQVLTLNDNQSLTTIGKLPLNNQLGGIIQSLMVFKDDSNIFQITGDPTTSNLAVNSLNVATGTQAPNSVVATPKGLLFIAPDGPRVINFNATVSDPIGIDGRGVSVPFISAVVPSRIAASCNGNILRITTQNGAASGSPSQEYWYDFARQIWSGPHNFPFSLAQPYLNTFITTPIAVSHSLWQSDVQQSSTSTFSENGSQMVWAFNTPLLPDNDEIVNNCLTESTIDLALSASAGVLTATITDTNGIVLNQVAQSAPGSATVWGQFTWGNAVWGAGGQLNLQPVQIPWTEPIAFARMAINISGGSAGGLKIGALHLRYQQLRTWTNTGAAAA